MTTLTDKQQETRRIATSIIEQLGGINRLYAIVGAYDCFSVTEGNGDSGWAFKFKGSKVANYCKIILNSATDTYTMEFMKIRGLTAKNTAKMEDVYGDMLKSLFEEETGLHLSFR